MNLKRKKSPSEKVCIILPAIIVVLINLYEIIFQPLNNYISITTSILLIFILFNIGLRELIVKKSKFGCYILFLVVIVSVVFINKYF